MDLSGVDYLWIIVMFLSAVWTLILTHTARMNQCLQHQNSSTPATSIGRRRSSDVWRVSNPEPGSRRPAADSSPERPPVPAPRQRPPITAPRQCSTEPTPVQELTESIPSQASVLPERSPSVRASRAPPKRPHFWSPNKFFLGGAARHGPRSPLICHGRPSPRIRHGRPSSLLHLCPHVLCLPSSCVPIWSFLFIISSVRVNLKEIWKRDLNLAGTVELQRIHWWVSDVMLIFSQICFNEETNSSTYWIVKGWGNFQKIFDFEWNILLTDRLWKVLKKNSPNEHKIKMWLFAFKCKHIVLYIP